MGNVEEGVGDVKIELSLFIRHGITERELKSKISQVVGRENAWAEMEWRRRILGELHATSGGDRDGGRV